MSECKYCDCKKGDSPTKSVIFETLNGGIFGPIILDLDIYEDASMVAGLGDDVVAKVKIKYCPMCGRKLELEPEEAADGKSTEE